MLDLKLGKGRRVIKSISTSMHAAHQEARYPTLLLTGAMAHGVCALESSSSSNGTLVAGDRYINYPQVHYCILIEYV